jgi:triosephosphate isomerase
MLLAAGCQTVIIGHSERRQYFGETDQTVNKRVLAARAAGLEVIVCVGETLGEREKGATGAVVQRQLEGAFSGVTPATLGGVTLAYEPVWAIGTGKTATPAQAQEVHAFIRGWLGGRFDPGAAGALRIQYGGSVKKENAAELLGQPDIDGALVGGASLKAVDFLGIVKAAG